MEVGLMRTHALLLLLFLILLAPGSTEGGAPREEEERGGEGHGRKGTFLLRSPKQVMKTDGGNFKVFRGFRRRESNTPMHVGFINMEPNTLFVPQYLDASLILFVRRGEVRVGWIYKDKLVEKNLRIGDVYRIPAGSAFYMVNMAKGQRLQIICSIDTTESLGGDVFESFFIAGGKDPIPVLAGFDAKTLTAAFNVSVEELSPIMKRQKGGPIVYMTSEDQPSKWAYNLMKLKHKERRAKMGWDEQDHDDEEEDAPSWTWRKFLDAILGEQNRRGKGTPVRSPESYNLYARSPDFQNDFGWSVVIDEHDYDPLGDSSIGIYFVNLTAGAMLAPHVNPTATEYGVVLKGSGILQVVFPNGTSGMNAEVKEGDVFWIPRYFPFCQIASRSGPMELFGFTTSSRTNRPQFLVGQSSVLRTMSGPEIATAFGVSKGRFERIVSAQKESIIMPGWPDQTPPHKKHRRSHGKEEGEEEGEHQQEKEERRRSSDGLLSSAAFDMVGDLVMGF